MACTGFEEVKHFSQSNFSSTETELGDKIGTEHGKFKPEFLIQQRIYSQ